VTLSAADTFSMLQLVIVFRYQLDTTGSVLGPLTIMTSLPQSHLGRVHCHPSRQRMHSPVTHFVCY